MPDPVPSGKSDTLPKKFLTQAPQIETLRKRFDEARDNGEEARQRSLKDHDYLDGPKQLDSEVRTTLGLRKQPPIYTNYVRPAVNGILGVLEASRVDPRGYPRNPGDEKAADVCSKTLRYIAEESNFDELKLDVAADFLVEGTGATIIEMDGEEISPVQIRWEEFYYDPYARRNDLKDARFMGIAKWIDESDLMSRYDERIGELGSPFAGGGLWGLLGSSWEDRPEGRGWIDRSRRRVLLVEEYHLAGGEWRRCLYVANGVLEYGPSPYLDDKKRPINPIEAVSCYVAGGTESESQGMRPNARYGVVRDMLPQQDELNASRSRSLHLHNSRQVQRVDENAPPVDADIARTEAAKADGVIPAGYAIVSTAEQSQGSYLRMQDAKQELSRLGPTPAVLGRDENASQSGRARLVSQQAGLTELARPLARLKDWELRCYKQMWWRAQQFKNNPWWIRVTDELQAPEFLQVNEPVMGPVPQQDPMTGEVTVSMGVVGMNNRLAEMDMDIILDTVPDQANLQQEVFAELMDLIRTGLDVFDPRFELLIEMAPLQDKAKVLERLKGKREEFQQAQGQAQQQLAQIAEAKEIAEIDNKQADTGKKRAETAETEIDTLIKSFQAGQSSVPEPLDNAGPEA